MHEIGIVKDIINRTLELSKGKKVKSVKILIGNLSGVEVEDFKYLFKMEAKSSEIKDAQLILEEVTGQLVILKEVELYE